MADGNLSRRVYTYDTTLRDGEQGEGIAFSVEDKLRVLQRLDAFGIDFIEGGFPASNKRDEAFFKEAGKLPLSHASLVAFGSTCKKGVPAAEDAGLAVLAACSAPVLALVGKTSRWHVQETLGAAPQENLRMIADSVAFCVAAGKTVVFDAEHFFDGYAHDAAYALECLRVAARAGAEALVLCDTNGAALPPAVEEAVRAVAAALPQVQLGIHCHNDSACAVANTLAAVRAGAVQVQGTVNGIGERTGNADLLAVIANLELKMGCRCVGLERLRELRSVARFVAEVCNVSLSHQQPYTGKSAFVHKAGLHASALSRNAHAYEHVDPEAVGNTAQVAVSRLAGKASLLLKAKSLGIDLSPNGGVDEHRLQGILDDLKQREAAGYSYELADASLALLLRWHVGAYRPYFTLESFRVIVDDHEDKGALAKDAASEATIKIHVGDQRFVATGEGTGPVGALDTALRMAITESYPAVQDMELVDFKVRILDENVGTSAITRVTITTRHGADSWASMGVSENILEASWNALVDSIEYGLLRAGVPTRN